MSFKSPTETPFIKFLGGKNLIFSLITIILLCLSVLLLNAISFVFVPIQVLISSIISPLLLAIIFYYIFTPLVDFLERKKVPRAIGSALSLIILLALILGSIIIIVPIIIEQVTSFIQIFPSLLNNFFDILEKYSSTNEFRQYYGQAITWLNSSLTQISNQMLATLGTTLRGISSILSTLSVVFFTLFTFPMFLFFLLMDKNSFKNTFLKIFPSNARFKINAVIADINLQVGAYIKGRLLVSFIIGVYYFFLFNLIGLDYAFALAILSGVASLIPYIGSIISLIPCIIVAAIKSPIIVLQTLLIWAFAQLLDGNILGPSIIGKNLKMHPMTIIIVLIVMGNLMGIVGMIIGIPLYAIIRIFVGRLFALYTRRYNIFFANKTSKY